MTTTRVLQPPASPSRQEPAKRRELVLHIALLIVVAFIATLPVQFNGAPDLSHDGYLHSIWTWQFSTQFWHGELFPRWYMDANGGLGGPTGFFYPPMTNYAAALFWPFMRGHDPLGWWSAGYALILATILSSITGYLWLRCLAPPKAALFGAIVYSIAPYHLAMDAYTRCAMAEFWLFVWFPLVMLAAEGVIRGSRWAIPGGALSYALAVLSHPTMAVCFAPVPLLYVFLFSETGRSKERLKATAMMGAGLVLGIALDAQYLVPAKLEQGKIFVEHQTRGPFDYRNQWLIGDAQQLKEMTRYISDMYTGRLAQYGEDIPFRARMLLLTALTLAAGAVCFSAIVLFEKTGRTRRAATFYMAAAIVGVFFMNKVSSPFWRAFGFLKFLSFPFRLNVFLVMCVAALAALAAPYLVRPRVLAAVCLLTVLVVTWIELDVYAAAHAFSGARNLRDRASTRLDTKPIQVDFPSMWPRPSNMSLWESKMESFLQAHPPKAVQLAAAPGQTQGSARVLSWHPRRVLLEVDAPQDAQLIVNYLYYAGWRSRMPDGRRLPVSPSPDDGLMQIPVPQGKYVLTLELPKDGAERAGTFISWISLVLLVGLALLIYRAPRRPLASPTAMT